MSLIGMDLSNHDAHWLAGLLEGEGTFLRGSPSAPNSPRVSVEMTDQDVVQRAARLMGVVSVYRGHRHPERGWKPAFRATVKCARAVRLMLALKPLLSAQRRRDVERALSGYAPTHLRTSNSSTCTQKACDLPTEARGLCHRHYLALIRANGGHAPRVTIDQLNPRLDLHSTPEARRAWLAGLLEGEGTFAMQRNGTGVVSVQMCSRDVVIRAAAEMRAPTVRERRDPRAEARGWSTTHETKVVSRKAIALMRELRPLLGERRKRDIDRALAVVDARPYARLIPGPKHCSIQGCSAPHRGRGLCHKHYMRWLRHEGRAVPREFRSRSR